MSLIPCEVSQKASLEDYPQNNWLLIQNRPLENFAWRFYYKTSMYLVIKELLAGWKIWSIESFDEKIRQFHSLHRKLQFAK